MLNAIFLIYIRVCIHALLVEKELCIRSCLGKVADGFNLCAIFSSSVWGLCKDFVYFFFENIGFM